LPVETGLNKETKKSKGCTLPLFVSIGQASIRQAASLAEEDYYVCPMGQHLEHIGDVQSISDLGYVSSVSKYRAQNCTGCPLRCLCYKGAANQRGIEVNHRNNAFRAEAKRLLTSEKGLHYRSMRPIEPEAVFDDIVKTL